MIKKVVFICFGLLAMSLVVLLLMQQFTKSKVQFTNRAEYEKFLLASMKNAGIEKIMNKE